MPRLFVLLLWCGYMAVWAGHAGVHAHEPDGDPRFGSSPAAADCVLCVVAAAPVAPTAEGAAELPASRVDLFAETDACPGPDRRDPPGATSARGPPISSNRPVLSRFRPSGGPAPT